MNKWGYMALGAAIVFVIWFGGAAFVTHQIMRGGDGHGAHT